MLLLATFFYILSVQLLFSPACFSLSSLRHAIKAETPYFLLQTAIGTPRVSNRESCDPLGQKRDLTLDLPITSASTLKMSLSVGFCVWLFVTCGFSQWQEEMAPYI